MTVNKPTPGLVGRMVMHKVKRGEQSAEEVCEVMACQVSEGGYWQILIATHDGALLQVDFRMIRLCAEQVEGGPYR